MNTKKPPFDNLKVRPGGELRHRPPRRSSRPSHQGGAVLGAAMAPKPYGVWGLLEKDLLALAGLRQGRPDDEGQATKLLGEAGITAREAR